MKFFLFATMLSGLTCSAFAKSQTAVIREAQTKVLKMIANVKTPSAAEKVTALLNEEASQASSMYATDITPELLEGVAIVVTVILDVDKELSPLEALEQHKDMVNSSGRPSNPIDVLIDLLQNEKKMAKFLNIEAEQTFIEDYINAYRDETQ